MKRILSVITALLLISATIFAEPNFMLKTKAEEAAYSGNVENGGFEEGEWPIANRNLQVLTMLAKSGHSGAKSQGLWRKKATTSPAIFSGKTKEGYIDTLDKTLKYSVKLYIKTDDVFDGKIAIKLKQNNESLKMGGSSDYYVVGSVLKNGKFNSADWYEVITPGFTAGDGDISIELSINGAGILYFDDLDIVPDPENGNLIKNGGFEEGKWGQEGDGTQTVVTDDTDHSPKAVKVVGIEGQKTNIVTGIKEFDRSKKYVLSVSMKTEGVKKGSLEVRILERGKREGENRSNWLTVYGSEAFCQPTLDDNGNSEWTKYTVNINRFNDYEEDYGCAIYVMLNGAGTVWVDNVSLREKKVNTDTQAGVVTADTPTGEVEPMTAVRLMTATDPANIYYTVDGSDPKKSPDALLYDDENGVIITQDTVIKAYVASEDGDGDVCELEYTCPSILPDPDFEKGVWSSNVSGMAELDTVVKKNGNSSMKIEGNGSGINASTGLITLDSTYDYKLSFWAKTEDMLQDGTAYLSVFLRDDYGGFSHLNCNGENVRGTYFGSQNKLFDIKKTQDWTYYEVDLEPLLNTASAINLIAGINNDMGTVWFDDIRLIAKQKGKETLKIVSATQEDQMVGNIYTQNIMEDFTIIKDVTFKSYSNLEESGVLSYVIKKANGEVLGTGEIEDAGMAPLGTSNYKITLSPIAEYGTFTVEFKMQNKRGYTYDVGVIKVSRVRDGGVNKASKLAVSEHLLTGGYLNNKYDKESIDKYLDMLKAAGVKMVRDETLWRNIETAENVYSIPEYWDTYIDSANEHGIQVLLGINGSSSSYHGSTDFPRTEEEVTAFCNYAKAVAEHFKGRVYAYELLNETNYSKVCTGEEYAGLLKEFYKTIKAVDSNNKVVAGVLSQTDILYTEDILRAGGADYMDVYSFHPYVYPDSPETAQFLKKMEDMKATFEKYTAKKIPFWLTEVGWSTFLSDAGVTEEEQANYQVRVLSMLETLDYVEYIFHYETHAETNLTRLEQCWGMVQGVVEGGVNTYSARQNYVSYAAHMALLNGYKFKEELKLANGLYTYKYSNSETEKDIYMLWTNDLNTPATIKLSEGEARYFDIYGNVLGITYNSDNVSFTENVSGRPVYLMLDKSVSIVSVVLGDNKTEDTDKKPSNQNQPVINNNAVNDAPSHTPEYFEGENQDNSGKKTYKVKRIKKTSGKKNNGKNGLSPLAIGLICGGAVILAAGVTLIIIFIKKKKKKQN